ncbi:SDR family NAD(P)-dependent oxidoreductase [Blastococcus sp. SYSU D00669]
MTHTAADGLPLAGTVAVVTGAGRGIGRALALALAGAGARVVLAARSLDQLEVVAGEVRSRGGTAAVVPTDVTSAAEVEALVERAVTEFGRLDVLVNNAGIIEFTPLLEISDDGWDAVLSTNLRSAFLGTRAAARVMREQGGGRIVNIASNFAFRGISGYASYSAAKAGLVALTRTAAVELARYGITVNAVAPGYVATDMNAVLRDDETTLATVLKGVPLRRMGDPEELGDLVVLLAGRGGGFITGETVVVDGGQLAR